MQAVSLEHHLVDIRGSAVVVVGLMLIFILLNLYTEAVSCQYSVLLPERK